MNSHLCRFAYPTTYFNLLSNHFLQKQVYLDYRCQLLQWKLVREIVVQGIQCTSYYGGERHGDACLNHLRFQHVSNNSVHSNTHYYFQKYFHHSLLNACYIRKKKNEIKLVLSFRISTGFRVQQIYDISRDSANTGQKKLCTA